MFFKYLSLVTAYLTLNIEIYLLCRASELLQCRLSSFFLSHFMPCVSIIFFLCTILFYTCKMVDLNRNSANHVQKKLSLERKRKEYKEERLYI